jgi:hypothetical protein
MIDNLDQLREAVRANAESLAISILGEPNRAMSRADELRFGSKGGISVVIRGERAGIWCDFATSEGGDLIDLIKRGRSCDFAAAATIAADLLRHPVAPTIKPAPRPKTYAQHPDAVDLIWNQTVPIVETLAERYLNGRRLMVPPDIADLRFHPACPRGAERYPAMVAAFRDIHSDELVGLHRTFLNPDGSRIEGNAKMMLGRVAGAAIKLSPADQVEAGLHVAEGIESTIALLHFGLAPAWALGSAGAILNLPVLAGVESLTIAVDQDEAGRKSSAACGERWRSAGREVRFVQALDADADIADLAKGGHA